IAGSFSCFNHVSDPCQNKPLLIFHCLVIPCWILLLHGRVLQPSACWRTGGQMSFVSNHHPHLDRGRSLAVVADPTIRICIATSVVCLWILKAPRVQTYSRNLSIVVMSL